MARLAIYCTLKMGGIVQAVQEKTYLTGVSREAAGMNYREVSQLQATDDDDGVICQAITNAVGDLQVGLGEYLDDGSTRADDDVLEAVLERGDVTFNFRMPTNFDTSATKGLATAMSDYVTNLAISRWYLITDKGDAAEYAALAAEALERAKAAMYRRRRRVRGGTAEKDSGTGSQGNGSGGGGTSGTVENITPEPGLGPAIRY